MKTTFNVDPNKIYTLNEVCKIVRIGRQTIDKAVKSGRLETYRVGERQYRATGEQVIEYIDNCLQNRKVKA